MLDGSVGSATRQMSTQTALRGTITAFKEEPSKLLPSNRGESFLLRVQRDESSNQKLFWNTARFETSGIL